MSTGNNKRRQFEPPDQSPKTMIPPHPGLLDSCQFSFTVPSPQRQSQNLFELNNMQTYQKIPEGSPYPPPSLAIDPSLGSPYAISASAATSAVTSENVTLQDSLTAMNLQSYEIRDSISANLVSDTTTSVDYGHYLKNYDTWWYKFQYLEIQNNPGYISIPPRPITAAKVAHFLNHEIQHPRRKRGSGEGIEGSTVGISVIKCTISALERQRRRDEHLYPDDPAAQKAL
ncbi:hypothetical protein M422DRAFT_245796 [Sphaerobolus stellatus SS14]|nr:hypothetical protein M422DRAFT_245796 [Sphaerobolus stellatus SS14]